MHQRWLITSNTGKPAGKPLMPLRTYGATLNVHQRLVPYLPAGAWMPYCFFSSPSCLYPHASSSTPSWQSEGKLKPSSIHHGSSVFCVLPAMPSCPANRLLPPSNPSCSALFDTWQSQPRFLTDFLPVLASTCCGLIFIYVLQCLWLQKIFRCELAEFN